MLVKFHGASAFAIQRAFGKFEMIDGDMPTMIAPCLNTGFIQFGRNIKRQGAFDLNTVQRINITVQCALNIYALRQGKLGIHELHGEATQAECRHDNLLRLAIPDARRADAAFNVHGSGKAAHARQMNIRVIFQL